MDLKIYFMFAGVLTLAVSIGLIAGAITACKLIRFGVRTSYEVHNGKEVFSEKKSSSLVDVLNEQEQKKREKV